MLKIPFLARRPNRRYRLVALEPRPDGFILAGLRGSPDAPELAYFGKFPADNPLQSGEDGFADQIQPFIDEAGAKGALATTLLNRSEINFILTEAPDVERSEWRDALKWRIRDLIDFPVEQAVIDAFPVAVEPPSEGPQAFVVAARQELVRNRVRGATEAGLDLRYVDIPDLAHRNLARLLPEPPSGTCLLILDEHNPLISITKGGELAFSREVGLDVGEELKRITDELGGDPQEAQRQRVEEGLSGGEAEASGGQLFGGPDEELALEEETEQAAEPPHALADFADRLALEIQRSLDYYDSRFRQAAIQKIYLGGEGARIQGLEAYLEEALGLDFEFFHPLDYLAADSGIQEHRQEIAYPINEGILAIGAGLRMLDPELG